MSTRSRRPGVLVLAVVGLLLVAGVAMTGLFRRGGGEKRDGNGNGAPPAGGSLDEAGLRAALQRDLGLPKDGLKIELGPDVPGVLVFFAYVEGSPHSNVTGAYDGRIHTDFDETSKLVLGALGFGQRDVDPVVVAGAIGKLEGNPGTPYLTQEAIELSGDPATMVAPHMITVDGQPAVEFWNLTARTPPWRSLVVRRPDGTAEVRRAPA